MCGSTLRVPYDFIFAPETGELEGFQLDLVQGTHLPLAPNADGRLPCERLGLQLGLWGGTSAVSVGRGCASMRRAERRRRSPRSAPSTRRARGEAQRRVAELEAQVRALQKG